MTAALPPFVAFESIPRLKRGCLITEKIDGTNSCVYVGEDGQVAAGSRNRWITPQDDNYGFARWVAEHEETLRAGLGFGLHYGEWWGCGVKRRYGIAEKRWSLFNVTRWRRSTPPLCHLVPVLYEGDFSTKAVDDALLALSVEGSRAAPGFMQPEGVVIYLPAARQLFKVTLGNDGHKTAKAKVQP